MSLTLSYCLKNPLKNLTNFNGRTRRMEYWVFYLCTSFLTSLVCIVFLFGLHFAGLDIIMPAAIIEILYLLLFLSITVRRLHDTNRSGWWFLLVFIPFIGQLVFLIFMCLKGTEGENRFGKDPKAEDEKKINTAGEQKLVKYCR